TVAMKPLPACSHVHAHDVALFELVSIGDAVDHHIVHADAGACRIAAVVQEGGLCTLRHDEIVDCLVDCLGGDARPHHFACQSTRCRGNFTGLAHHHKLSLVLNWYHAYIPSAFRISLVASSMG